MGNIPTIEREAREQAERHWRDGDCLQAGRVLFETLSKEEQPIWAGRILDFASKWLEVPMCAVASLHRIVRDKRKWSAAHEAFVEIRRATMRLEARKPRTRTQELMLCQCGLAENVAKVVYNATPPLAPFDKDAGWWILPCLKSCVDCLGRQEFEQATISLLFGSEHLLGGKERGSGGPAS